LNVPYRPDRASLTLAAIALVLLGGPLRADISGFVYREGTTTPIVGATVHIRADGGVSNAITAADGSFTITDDPGLPVDIAASVPYDRSAAFNYVMGGVNTFNGATGVIIELEVLPSADVPGHVPASADTCGSCHKSVFPQWQGSNHAGTARNAWVMDLYSGNGTGTPSSDDGYVFRNTHAAGETGFCSACHAPMAEVLAPGTIYLDEVTEQGALEGVNCVTCHQMDSVNAANLNALHVVGGKATYRFPAGTSSADAYVWGPLDDVTFNNMRPSHSTLHKSSLLCASCHQYNRPDNNVAGQHTYTEWLASSFAVPGPGYRTCQDCHMPPSTEPGALCVFVAEDRPGEQRRRHIFIGSTPDMLQANLDLTAAAVEIAPGRIRVDASVNNFGAGHNFPTGISIRNAMLVVAATWNGQPLPQVAGPTIPFWGSDDVPGDQPGDLAGQAGKGFAKVLEGRIDGAGPTVRPVLFIDAEAVQADTAIPSGATDNTSVEFQLPPGAPPGAVVLIEARLLYRRAFRALQVTKGWTLSAHGGPIEIEVANRQLQVVSQGVQGTLEVPALGLSGLLVLALALAAVGIATVARRR
jgi:hypothetical protein